MHALTMLVRLSSRPIRRLAAIAPVLALQAALTNAKVPAWPIGEVSAGQGVSVR